MFVEKKHLWERLIPQSDGDSTALVQKFFGCVASLMSIQLREMVVNSLADFLKFFQIHASGNDFDGKPISDGSDCPSICDQAVDMLTTIAGEFDELRFVMAQVMLIKLKIEDPKILFEPTFRECRDIILRCFSEIIASGEGLSRVECEVFPEMKGQRLLLRSVKIEESLVAEFTDKAMNIFKKNTVGPQK